MDRKTFLRGDGGIFSDYDDPEIVFLYEGHSKGYKKYIKRDEFQSARYGEVNDSERSDGAKRTWDGIILK